MIEHSRPVRGNLFVVSAPSGAGKTSLVKALIEADTQLVVSVSHTTRSQRPGEQDGVNYHFVDREQFLALQTEGAFFESAEVFGNLYGTAQGSVDAQRDAGVDVILEIDWQGANQVRAQASDACFIFILPPSLDTLEQRLRSRKQDDDATIAARLAGAQAEISHYHEADYVVLNDDFETALTDLRAVIHSRRLASHNQTRRLEAVVDDLLGR